jgi:hypothetical protein
MPTQNPWAWVGLGMGMGMGTQRRALVYSLEFMFRVLIVIHALVDTLKKTFEAVLQMECELPRPCCSYFLFLYNVILE